MRITHAADKQKSMTISCSGFWAAFIFCVKAVNWVIMEPLKFNIKLDAQSIPVAKAEVNGFTVYVLMLHGKVLKLTQAKTKDHLAYWTFLPAGKGADSHLAQKLGKLIEQSGN
jgi:hypothetical protein